MKLVVVMLVSDTYQCRSILSIADWYLPFEVDRAIVILSYILHIISWFSTFWFPSPCAFWWNCSDYIFTCSWVKPVFRSPSLLLHNLVLDEGSISEEVETTLINVKCSFYNNVNCSLVHSIIRNSADFGHFLHETDCRINRCAQYHQNELHIVDLSSSIVWFKRFNSNVLWDQMPPNHPRARKTWTGLGTF